MTAFFLPGAAAALVGAHRAAMRNPRNAQPLAKFLAAALRGAKRNCQCAIGLI